MVDWFGHDSNQTEILVRQAIKEFGFALTVHRLRCTQDCRYSLGDLIEIGQPYDTLEDGDVPRVVGIENEAVWLVISHLHRAVQFRA